MAQAFKAEQEISARSISRVNANSRPVTNLNFGLARGLSSFVGAAVRAQVSKDDAELGAAIASANESLRTTRNSSEQVILREKLLGNIGRKFGATSMGKAERLLSTRKFEGGFDATTGELTTTDLDTGLETERVTPDPGDIIIDEMLGGIADAAEEFPRFTAAGENLLVAAQREDGTVSGSANDISTVLGSLRNVRNVIERDTELLGVTRLDPSATRGQKEAHTKSAVTNISEAIGLAMTTFANPSITNALRDSTTNVSADLLQSMFLGFQTDTLEMLREQNFFQLTGTDPLKFREAMFDGVGETLQEYAEANVDSNAKSAEHALTKLNTQIGTRDALINLAREPEVAVASVNKEAIGAMTDLMAVQIQTDLARSQLSNTSKSIARSIERMLPIGDAGRRNLQALDFTVRETFESGLPQSQWNGVENAANITREMLDPNRAPYNIYLAPRLLEWWTSHAKKMDEIIEGLPVDDKTKARHSESVARIIINLERTVNQVNKAINENNATTGQNLDAEGYYDQFLLDTKSLQAPR